MRRGSTVRGAKVDNGNVTRLVANFFHLCSHDTFMVNQIFQSSTTDHTTNKLIGKS